MIRLSATLDSPDSNGLPTALTSTLGASGHVRRLDLAAADRAFDLLAGRETVRHRRFGPVGLRQPRYPTDFSLIAHDSSTQCPTLLGRNPAGEVADRRKSRRHLWLVSVTHDTCRSLLGIPAG